MKTVFYYLKRFIVATIILYAYNQFAVSFNGIVPINIITILCVSILGIPAVVGIVIFKFLLF